MNQDKPFPDGPLDHAVDIADEAIRAKRDAEAKAKEDLINQAIEDGRAQPAPVPVFRDTRGNRIPLGSKVLWAVRGNRGIGGAIQWGTAERFVTKPGGGRPMIQVRGAEGFTRRAQTMRCDRVIVDFQNHYERLAKTETESAKLMADVMALQRSMAAETLAIGKALREVLEAECNLEDLTAVAIEAVDRLIPPDPEAPDDEAARVSLEAEAERLGLGHD